MKKFFKLCLAVAALATMFGFASCSNDSSNDSTTTPATKTVKTTTVKIGDTEYAYTETNGKVDTSDKVTVADDGSITVTVADGSKVKFSKDGKTITYTDKDGKVYTGQTGGESITLKSEDGKEIAATVSSKTEPSANAAPAATENVFKEKTFVSDEGMSFVFGSDGNLTAAVKVDEKLNITKQAYTVNGNAFSATIGKMNASGTLSGTTLTAGDGDPKHVGTFAQTSGSNGFGGKSFISSDGTKLVVFANDSKIFYLRNNEKKILNDTYSVNNGTATGAHFKATISEKTLSFTPEGEAALSLTLIE